MRYRLLDEINSNANRPTCTKHNDSRYSIGTELASAHIIIQNIDAYADGLMQKRRNSSALAMDLQLFCITRVTWPSRLICRLAVIRRVAMDFRALAISKTTRGD